MGCDHGRGISTVHERIDLLEALRRAQHGITKGLVVPKRICAASATESFTAHAEPGGIAAHWCESKTPRHMDGVFWPCNCVWSLVDLHLSVRCGK